MTAEAMSPRPIARAVLTLCCLSAAAACGPTGGSKCDQSIPSCPAVVPDFSSDVLPIIQAVCANCHAPGGVEASLPITSYDEITSPRIKTTAFSLVLGCSMPPADAPRPLGADERRTLLAWFACGTPDAGSAGGGSPDGGGTDGGDPDAGDPDAGAPDR